MFMENLMEGIGKYKIKEENDDFDEETLQPIQLQGFFEHKKAKGMYARNYDYNGSMKATTGMMIAMRDMVNMMKT